MGLRARAVVDGCSTADPDPPSACAMLVGVRPSGEGGISTCERDGHREGKRHLRRRLGGLTDAPTARGEAPAPAVSLSRHERGVRGGGGLERRAVHMSAGRTRGGELLEGLRWGSCGEERIASASHVLTCHVVSSTSRPERRASHHATRSGPAHMSMSEVLRARTTMFACAGVCRHFSEPAASHHENGITIRFGNPPRTSLLTQGGVVYYFSCL